MNALSLRNCFFTLTVSRPMATLARISELLFNKKINIMIVHSEATGEDQARVTILCKMERDRVAYIGRHFEELHGVTEVDWMTATVRTKQFK